MSRNKVSNRVKPAMRLWRVMQVNTAALAMTNANATRLVFLFTMTPYCEMHKWELAFIAKLSGNRYWN